METEGNGASLHVSVSYFLCCAHTKEVLGDSNSILWDSLSAWRNRAFFFKTRGETNIRVTRFFLIITTWLRNRYEPELRSALSSTQLMSSPRSQKSATRSDSLHHP